jgi:hypothetical protein
MSIKFKNEEQLIKEVGILARSNKEFKKALMKEVNKKSKVTEEEIEKCSGGIFGIGCKVNNLTDNLTHKA